MSRAKTVVLKLLFAWQWTRRFRQPACRFYPSCSEYTRQAVEKHGIAAGMRLGVVRICKCHPFHDGGVDEVPEVMTPLFASVNVWAANFSKRSWFHCAAPFAPPEAGEPLALPAFLNRYENRSKTGFCRKQR